MLTSVGASDMTPRTGAMRLVGALEPVLGLVLISAWITWVLSIYPIIAERRMFSREVSLLRRAQPDANALVDETPLDAVAGLLRDLTAQVVRVGIQLSQARITYYFQNEDPDLSLAANLPYLLDVAREAEQHGREPLLRHYGTRLRMAVEDLLKDIGTHHLGVDATPDRIIHALARDHLRADSAPTG